jgi:hypothetical protein
MSRLVQSIHDLTFLLSRTETIQPIVRPFLFIYIILWSSLHVPKERMVLLKTIYDKARTSLLFCC